MTSLPGPSTPARQRRRCGGIAKLTSGVVIAALCVGAALPAGAVTPVPTTTAVGSSGKLVAGTTVSGASIVIPPAPTSGVVPTKTLVARALVRKVNVYAKPGDKKPSIIMDNRKNFSGAHVFVVVGKQDGWFHVLVPERPNGRTGWIRMADVGIYQHDYAIVVSLSTHSLTAYENGQAFLQQTVAVGQSKYPTPTGMFFIREVARPGNPKGAYGPYAFGLSAFSNVLTKFGAGNGQVGIHGTNRPDQLGTNASHGCIRMTNAAITQLAKRLPQGVPVDIRA